jgi:putative DNA primase/helicase
MNAMFPPPTAAQLSRWANANAKAIFKRVVVDELAVELMHPNRPSGSPLARFIPEQKPDLGHIVKALMENPSADIIEINRQKMLRAPCRGVISWDDFIAAEAAEQAKLAPAPAPQPSARVTDEPKPTPAAKPTVDGGAIGEAKIRHNRFLNTSAIFLRVKEGERVVLTEGDRVVREIDARMSLGDIGNVVNEFEKAAAWLIKKNGERIPVPRYVSLDDLLAGRERPPADTESESEAERPKTATKPKAAPKDEPPPKDGAATEEAPDVDEAADEGEPQPKAASSHARAMMVRASDIRPEKIQWLWPSRFALGKFSLIAGNPGLGKSQLTIHIATQVTTGGIWPNGEGRAPLGSVVILSCEDDAADTLVPRLIAAGADASRVHIVEAIREAGGPNAPERQFDLAKDVQTLCRAIDEIGDVRLVIIDPITAYLGTGKDVDSHKNAEVRAALAPLQVHASKYGFAAVGVTHLNKGGGTEALMRVLGSLGFVAAARVAFLVVADTANERTLFIPMKNNIGAKQPGLAFRIVPKVIADGIQTSCIEWDADEVTASADEALAAAAGRGGDKDSDKSSLGETMNFLRDVLAEGPTAAKAVEQQAKEAGISKATLRRAKAALGVTARHRGDGGTGGRGEWIWEMPEQITLRQSESGD